jgi:hypothetical protein
MVTDPIEHTNVLPRQLNTLIDTAAETYVEDSDIPLEELGNVEPSLIGGVKSSVESPSDGVGAAGEFTDRLVDTKLLPDIGKIQVVGDFVTAGSAHTCPRSCELTSRSSTSCWKAPRECKAWRHRN